MKHGARKTVYILGAGFSKEAGNPPQKEIVAKLLLNLSGSSDPNIASAVRQFKSFLSNILSIPETLHAKIPLEDIFTPLDRCMADNLSFRGMEISKVAEMRSLINLLISASFEFSVAGSDGRYIERFARYLVKKSSARSNQCYHDVDPVAVISTNWDILLDNAIHEQLRSFNLDPINSPGGVVDYCCHISSFQDGDKSILPGLRRLGEGGFNVKLLKLHGSLNWLFCPRCQRVYVAFDQKIALHQLNSKEICRHCQKNFTDEDPSELVSNLTMPTFLKNFNNTQYKLIWQNAGIELSEASKLVFIGYSLPDADFELRQLFSRMVRKNAEIEIVDYQSVESPNVYTQMIEKYELFFGSRKIVGMYNRGARDYFDNSEIYSGF